MVSDFWPQDDFLYRAAQLQQHQQMQFVSFPQQTQQDILMSPSPQTDEKLLTNERGIHVKLLLTTSKTSPAHRLRPGLAGAQ